MTTLNESHIEQNLIDLLTTQGYEYFMVQILLHILAILKEKDLIVSFWKIT